MSFSDATAPPSQSFEVIEEVHALIASISALTTAIGGASFVHKHRLPRPPKSSSWKRVVVRAPVYGEGYGVNVGKTTGQRIDVVIEVHESTPNPDQFIAYYQDLIFQNIVGQSLTLTKGTGIGEIQPLTQPTAAAYDADDHSLYSVQSFVYAVASN